MSKEKYDDDFQREAVKLILTSGKSQREISRDLGVSEWQLSAWKKKFKAEMNGDTPLGQSADERIRALEKENAILKQERDILKKAMGITLKP